MDQNDGFVTTESLGVVAVTAARIGERIASDLRKRIVDGALSDGARLPKEDTLRRAFGVGKPAIREALRILETEGLITVQRGNRGGAIVRAPTSSGIAYSLGMVLTAEAVQARDLAMTVREIELLCAGLCAQRSDRATTVVPRLRAIQERSERDIDGESRAVLREFHEELARSCGRRTLTILAGSLETLWTGHVRAETTGLPMPTATGRGPGRTGSLEEHSLIIDAIEVGDVERTRMLLSNHLERVQVQSTTIDLNRPMDILQHPIAAPGAR